MADTTDATAAEKPATQTMVAVEPAAETSAETKVAVEPSAETTVAVEFAAETSAETTVAEEPQKIEQPNCEPQQSEQQKREPRTKGGDGTKARGLSDKTDARAMDARMWDIGHRRRRYRYHLRHHRNINFCVKNP